MSKLATLAVEYNVTEHCNLRCAGCDHASPLVAERFADPAAFRRDVTALATVLRAREFKLVGGEPTLHPELHVVARAARESSIADRIALVTNGTRLSDLDERVLDCIDALHVSAYPGVTLHADLVALERALRDRGIEFLVRHVNEFRHTLVAEPRSDVRTTERIYRRCKLAHTWSCHTLRDGRYYKCPPAALRGARDPAIDPRLDGVDLHPITDLRSRLASYLDSASPLAACAACLGTSGTRFPHRQLSRSEAAAGVDSTHIVPDRAGRRRNRWFEAFGRSSP